MKPRSTHPRRVVRATTLLTLIFFAAAISVCAQTTQQPAPLPDATHATLADGTPVTRSHATKATPAPSPQTSTKPSSAKRDADRPTLEHEFFRNVLRDERAIWTSPLHMRRADSRWLLPVSLSTIALVATDRHTAGALDDDDHLNISRRISYLGSIYGTGGIAATFYLVGRATHNARARETGLLGGEALINGGIVSTVLKSVSQRPRPRVDDASGEFFDRGNSFPSGHAMAAWSLASVVAEEYHNRRAVRFGAYGLATAVSLARFTGRNHFLSDALVGSAIGYGIGRYVYRTHHDPSLDAGDAQQASLRERSKLFPQVAPRYDRRERDYGLSLAWSF
jgi:membrane-associated phospholipid phosphatase